MLGYATDVHVSGSGAFGAGKREVRQTQAKVQRLPNMKQNEGQSVKDEICILLQVAGEGGRAPKLPSSCYVSTPSTRKVFMRRVCTGTVAFVSINHNFSPRLLSCNNLSISSV